jgi:hypothetical protein
MMDGVDFVDGMDADKIHQMGGVHSVCHLGRSSYFAMPSTIALMNSG